MRLYKTIVRLQYRFVWKTHRIFGRIFGICSFKGGFVEDCGFDAAITGSDRTVRPRAADALAAVPMLLARPLETVAAAMFDHRGDGDRGGTD